MMETMQQPYRYMSAKRMPVNSDLKRFEPSEESDDEFTDFGVKDAEDAAKRAESVFYDVLPELRMR